MAQASVGLIPKENLIQKVGASYARASAQIVSILRGLSPEHFNPTAQAVAMHHIREIVGRLDAEAVAWSGLSIGAAYREGKTVTRVKLEAIGAQRSKTYNTARHDKAIAGLTRLTTRDYLAANQTILKTAGKYMVALGYARKKMDAYQQEIQAFSSEEARAMIDDVIFAAEEEHIPAAGVGRMFLDKLLGILGGGDFININGRDYNLKAYSELVARTRMREAQTEATKELCKEYDNDLVQYSEHDNPCEECAQYEGEIFSLSGDSPDYDPLPAEAEPPVHPNCEHNLNPVSENALSLRSA